MLDELKRLLKISQRLELVFYVLSSTDFGDKKYLDIFLCSE